MIKALMLATIIVIAAAPALGWNQEECEEVNWNHPDCGWGHDETPPQQENNPPPSSEHSSSHRSHGGSKTYWAVDSAWLEENKVCYTAHKVVVSPAHGKTMRTIREEESITARACVPRAVFEKYGAIGTITLH